MERLIECLKSIEENESIEANPEKVITDMTLTREIDEIVVELLIDENGRCDWDNIDFLSKSGFAVFPLEKDRFGWLIGGIQTSRGIISYG